MNLIFVCSGNTCRSPLAEAAWQVVAREMDENARARLAHVRVGSAGLNARAGAAATQKARAVAASWGADLSAHRAQVWHPALADVWVAMTREQAAQLRFRLDAGGAPANATVKTLGDWLAPEAWPAAWLHETLDAARPDIPDPYGGSLEAYQECGQRILRGVRALAQTYDFRPLTIAQNKAAQPAARIRARVGASEL